MIRIREFKDAEDQRLYAGSVYKALAEHVSGKPIDITIDAGLSFSEIAKSLFSLAEIISAGHGITDITTDDDEYGFDPDDPADHWKR